MIREALQYLVGLGQPPTIQIGGIDYWTAKQTLVHPGDVPFCVHTLDGLLATLIPADGLAVQIDGPGAVRVYGPPTPGHRPILVMASLFVGPERTPWGMALDQERAIVWLLSGFVATPERAALLALLGNITSEAIHTATDDGVTQIVSTKRGVSGAKVPLTNPVTLRAHRTFAEISQPPSLHVVRVAQGGTGPSITIHDDPSGAWQLAATQSIADYLRERLPGVPVLA